MFDETIIFCKNKECGAYFYAKTGKSEYRRYFGNAMVCPCCRGDQLEEFKYDDDDDIEEIIDECEQHHWRYGDD